MCEVCQRNIPRSIKWNSHNIISKCNYCISGLGNIHLYVTHTVYNKFTKQVCQRNIPKSIKWNFHNIIFKCNYSISGFGNIHKLVNYTYSVQQVLFIKQLTPVYTKISLIIINKVIIIQHTQLNENSRGNDTKRKTWCNFTKWVHVHVTLAWKLNQYKLGDNQDVLWTGKSCKIWWQTFWSIVFQYMFILLGSTSTCLSSFFVQGLKKALPLIITTLYYHCCKGTRMSTWETNKYNYKSYYLYATKR